MQFGASGEVIAVDGNAICSTAKPGNPHSALQILSAYMTDNGVVLAQEVIHQKTNEIPDLRLRHFTETAYANLPWRSKRISLLLTTKNLLLRPICFPLFWIPISCCPFSTFYETSVGIVITALDKLRV